MRESKTGTGAEAEESFLPLFLTGCGAQKRRLRMGKFDNVKPGDTVYCISGDEDTGEDCSGYLFMACVMDM